MIGSQALTERRLRLFSLSIVAAGVLGGCATVDIDESIAGANERAGAFTGGNLMLARTDRQRQLMEQTADGLLDAPLSAGSAVQLALVNSPSLQVLLAGHWENASSIARSGRIPDPVFAFERLEFTGELELTRLLSVGLLDLLTYPKRLGRARRGIEIARLQLVSDVVGRVTDVRQAWVSAVVTGQLADYAEQVRRNADASSELARRMEAVGNFNRLARLRQQVFYADATTAVANARQSAVAAREALVRLLGLTETQVARLMLPERLPDLPAAPQAGDAVARAAAEGRLDVGIAEALLNQVAGSSGYEFLTGLTDIEATGISQTNFTDGERESGDGYEIALSLPIFNGISALRDQLDARTLAAVNRFEETTRAASSNLRESYSAYRTAWDVANHYRNEVVPLRRSISEEMQLEYNGMLIGVFELLADARSQVDTVMAAIRAEEQFWLADAALQATVIGRPTGVASVAVGGAKGGGESAVH